MPLNLSAFMGDGASVNAETEKEPVVPVAPKESKAFKIAKEAKSRRESRRRVAEKTEAVPTAPAVEEEIREPPEQKGSIDIFPPLPAGQPIRGEPNAAIKNLVAKFRKDDVVQALIEEYTWEELMMSLSNVCTYKAIAFRNKNQKVKEDNWLERAKRFHSETGTNTIFDNF